jgi:aminopeptidase N
MTNIERSIIAEAKRRFRLWASGEDRDAIHPNLRSAILSINISEGGRVEYNTVKEEYLRVDSGDAKETYLGSLGQTKDPELVSNYLDFLFSDYVAIQDIHHGASSLASNPKVRHLLWQYMKDHWDPVATRLSANNVVFNRFLQVGLPRFADYATAENILSFFKDKDTSAYERSLVVVLDAIQTNARYRERDEKAVQEWLQGHGYA